MSPAELLAAYDEVAPALRARAEAIARQIDGLLAADPQLKVHSVSFRVKSRASLAQKLARPDKSYDDLFSITDLVGVRVITYFTDAVDRVGEIIEGHLPVDFRHSIDKRHRPTTEFGYRSLHYVCRADGELPPRARFEIQVRTVLEHAWAEIEHDLGYKATEEIPDGVRRRLNRLAGLLELADQEFGAIRSDLESYARSLPARIESSGPVGLDRFSLVAVLDCLEAKELDSRIASVVERELGDDPFFPDYLVRMLGASGVRTTEEARRGIRDYERAIVSMVQPYFELSERLWQLSPKRMPSVPRGYCLFFLAHVEVLRASALRLEKIERLARLYHQLDYPDDPRAAHEVARMLVDAFEAIGLRGRIGS